MRKFFHKLILPLIICLLCISFFPVYAQDGIEITETETETETVIATQEIFTETPSVELTITETATHTPEFTLTNTAIPSATATRTPTAKPAVTCSLERVYQLQIIVSYTSNLPKPAANYTLIRSTATENGEKVSVLQVDAADYCSVLADLKGRPGVNYAEPNYEISLLDTIPNDGDYGYQYYLNNIRAPQGWDYTTGSPAVIIAVLDTGVDLTHPELASKLISGYDFVQKDAIPQDEHGHGTHVAGIAAAVTNNGAGIAGIAWGSEIMPLRVLDAQGNGSYANAAEAIRYAADHGARIINMSIGGSKYSEVLESAVIYAAEMGVILVAATGNSGASTVLFPAAFAPVVAVGATDSANEKANFSNSGGAIDVVAPGVSIFSTYPGGQYRFSSGTSMATPMVAGFAALLASLPGMDTSMEIIEVMKTTALDLGPKGFDASYGWGLIQIGPGVLKALGQLPTNTPTPTAVRVHHNNTPTSSPTKTHIYFYSNAYPTFSPLLGVGSATVTPGEISIQQVISATPTPTATSNPISATVTGQPEPQNEEQQNNPRELPLLLIGITSLGLGVSLLIFVRKRYFG